MSVDIKKLTEQQKDVISGIVQYRFYHRITERNVYDWLNNFKQEEVDLAIEILKHIDYYREDDIISILKPSAGFRRCFGRHAGNAYDGQCQ